MSPRHDGTMNFEEWMEEEFEGLEFDPGDTKELHEKEGNDVLDELIGQSQKRRPHA